MFHPSLLLLFLDRHFKTFPDLDDLTDVSVHAILPNFPDLKKRRRSSALRTRTRSLATWPIPRTPRVKSPKSSTRSLLWTMTRRSSTIRTTVSPISRKPRTRTLANRCSHSVWILCFARFSLVILLLKQKAKKACIGKPIARQRERERERKKRKEKVLWSVLHSRRQRKIHGTASVWVWRVTEILVLKSLRKFCSDGWDLQEHLERVLVKIQFREILLGCAQHGNPKFEAEKFRTHIIRVTTRAWTSKMTNIGSQSMFRSSSTWENTFM